VLVGVAVVAGVTLVTDVVVGRPEGVVTAVLAGLAAAVLWYAIPLRLRLRS
jgi:hypothetical protein